MGTAKKIAPRISVTVLLLCLLCIVSSCGESKSFIDKDSESIKQTYENNSDPDRSKSEAMNSAQSTQVEDTDKSSWENTERILEETTKAIAEDYTEILEDGRVKHTFHLIDDADLISVIVPPNWECGVDDAFSETFVDKYVTKDIKRLAVSKLQGTTVEQWTEWHAAHEGPLNGVTVEGCDYIGYYCDPQIEKDVHWRVYYFLIVSEAGILHSVSIYHNLDTDDENYFETVVIPTVESVIVE